MNPVPGNVSCDFLIKRLNHEFGADDLYFLYEFGHDIDAIVWRLKSLEGFDFSVSTHEGTLPSGVYSLESGIYSKGLLAHGEPVFSGEVNIEELIQVVKDHIAGKYS